jgi:hypothetical protein
MPNDSSRGELITRLLITYWPGCHGSPSSSAEWAVEGVTPARMLLIFAEMYLRLSSASALALWICYSPAQFALSQSPKPTQDVSYTQDRNPSIPWSIHVVRVPRRSGAFELHSMHGGSRAVGLGTVSEQVAGFSPETGIPIAAINGDFYQRQGTYLGNPRGLQILEGEIVSAPAGGPSFWIDAAGEPHTASTSSLIQVTWPNGTSASLGLNEARRENGIVLYTPAMGRSTRTRNGRELVLERAGDTAWLPLAASRMYVARVAQVRETGNTGLTPETLVISIGSGAALSCPPISVGAEVKISTATSPTVRGAKTAISGGPILVRGGKVLRVRQSDSDTYQAASAYERHPRSAVGWNDDYFFFVEVDGRQRLSVGMTLQELGAYLVKLGCTEAMNLDGGGSATLWYAGQVRNRPCDGRERLVANALVAVQKKPQAAHESPANAASGQ